MKVQDDLYTISTNIPGDVDFALSLDCNEAHYQMLLKLLPDNLKRIIETGLKRQPYIVNLENDCFQFGCVSILKETIYHNAEESYIPFEVSEFMPYLGIDE